MARETSYQSVGNPIQFSRLPRNHCELAFPYTPFKPSQDVRFALRVVGYLLYVATAAVLANSSIMMWGSEYVVIAVAIPLAMGIIVERLRSEQQNR